MANTHEKSIKYPGLNDTYTFLQNDATLSEAGKAADAKATGDAIAALQSAVTACFPLDAGDAAALANGTDIDSLLTPGAYKVTTAANAATMTGTPPTASLGYRLIVMETSQDNRVWQIAFVNGDYLPRCRYYNGSAWTDWRMFVQRDSPAFTGSPTAPTQSAGDSSTKLATTAYADRAAGSAIAAGLPLDSDNAATLSDGTDIDGLLTPGTYKVTTGEHAATMTGTPPTTATGYRLIVIETSQDNRVIQFALSNSSVNPRWRKYTGSSWSAWEAIAPLDSPGFTGSPTAPTQSAGDSSTKLATTAYADGAAGAAKSYADERIAAEGVGLLTDPAFLHKGLVINNGAWATQSSQYYAVIPVTPGATLFFEANATGNGNFAVLTAYSAPSAGGTPSFSAATGFTNTITVTKGTGATYTLPSDAHYLYVYLRNLSNGAYERIPASLAVDGYDWAKGVRESVNRVFALAHAPVKLRVMQYNCGMWTMGGNAPMTSSNLETKLANYKKLLRAYRPDLIGIEEWVDNITVSGSAVSMNARVFDPMYPYEAAYIYTGSSKGRTLKGKYALSDITKSSISSSAYGGSSSVLYSKAHMEIAGRRVCAVCTAFLPSTAGSGDPEIRAALMPKLLELLDGEEYAFLIVDLNNGGDGTVTDVQEGDSLNAIAETNGFKGCMGPYVPWTNTWQSQTNTSVWKAIDQIYYRNNGRIIFDNYTILTDEFAGLNSDHVPCIGDFTLL